MAVASKGLLDGNRLVEEYSASNKKKVYFISIPQGIKKCIVKFNMH